MYNFVFFKRLSHIPRLVCMAFQFSLMKICCKLEKICNTFSVGRTASEGIHYSVCFCVAAYLAGRWTLAGKIIYRPFCTASVWCMLPMLYIPSRLDTKILIKNMQTIMILEIDVLGTKCTGLHIFACLQPFFTVLERRAVLFLSKCSVKDESERKA